MKRIIISRTDNLGDVILTLPLAGVLKQYFPDCTIIFLGKSYTRPIIGACEFVDEFLDWNELSSIPACPAGRQHPCLSGRQAASSISAIIALKADIILHVFPDKEIQKLAKKAKIPVRIGTSHRLYSWLYCNKLVHYSRKSSNLHEAQLNLKLLEHLGITRHYTLSEIPSFYGLTKLTSSQADEPTSSRAGNVFKLILHPKSKGSAREWGLENFSRLIELLPEDKFDIFITGTKQEGDQMQEFLEKHKNRVTDMTGKLTLPELLSFINAADGLVAASTGPLHIAAALGKKVIGLYAPMRPIFPQRWAPIGTHATFLVLDKKCNDCRRSGNCECIRSILPEEVAGGLMS